VITPRTTRLVRVPDLHTFRASVASMAIEGRALDIRDRLVVVPTRAAAAHLVRTIEDAWLGDAGVVVLPDLSTASELVSRFADRLPRRRARLTDAEREVLLGVACRAARDEGHEPPFRLRPGLMAEILRFYDALARNQNSIDDFSRRALDVLEPGASFDRGAERLVRQTRFLAAAFHAFERLAGDLGDDEPALRRRLVEEPAPRPYRHAVLAVMDRAFDPHGLWPGDWDLLARIPGLERIDVLVTDTRLAGALHERMHRLMPGIEEVRVDPATVRAPSLITAAGGASVHTARDREEEIGTFARRVKQLAREAVDARLDRMALVVEQPLPYVYLAQETLRSAGIPCQLFDALPLAAEPFAAAFDLLSSAVSSAFARVPSIALLRSPHLRFVDADGEPLSARDISALDRALADAGYLGEPDALERLLDGWRAQEPERGTIARALRAGQALLAAAGELAPLRAPASVAQHLAVTLEFLRRHERLPGPDDPLRARQLRARTAILATLASLREAYARFDSAPAEFDDVAALVRRWIEGQTFAPRTGDSGVHIVDAASAPFGDFDLVQLAGLVDGEWPERPRRNIFYSPSILRALGWPAESDRLEGARAAFIDLLRLPSSRLVVSTFSLEADAIVGPSALVDELPSSGLTVAEEPLSDVRIFEDEALAIPPIDVRVADGAAAGWAAYRAAASPRAERVSGRTTPPAPRPYSLSALERYQDCAFKFFAADVLRLEEAPEDEQSLSPRQRGRFIHEVFQRFFEAWDASGGGAITTDRIDAARALFHDVADPLLARLPEAEAVLERARLFGSAISVGMVDVVLGIEAARPVAVRERLLEYRLEGDFALGAPGGTRVALRGVADRIDLLDGHRLRVIDYKTGYAPDHKRALQVPIYALCAQERLEERDGAPWTVDEAAYVAFTGKRTVVPVIRPGRGDGDDVLDAARARLLDVLGGIGGGLFPPKPHDEMMCRYCAYPSVCRKDYVGDE
jgi:RecB family exonuclease